MAQFITWFAALIALCAPVAECKQNCTGLMALKLAETGSTWFASLLEATPSYKIEEEIYTGQDQHISISKRQRKLKEVLSCEYFKSAKAVHGFTINPKNNIGIDWEDVVRTTGAYVVTWKRSNLMKTVVSIYRKGVQHVCGGKANIHEGRYENCGNEKVTIQIDNFLQKLQKQAHYYSELEKASAIANNAANNRSMSMYYENMQANQQREMDNLAKFLGDSRYSHKHVESNVVKKTSDDLREIIINFDDVVKSLTKLKIPAQLNCPVVEMFQETGFKVFRGCDYEGLAKYMDTIGINN